MMKRSVVHVLTLLFLCSSCKKEYDNFYSRPESLPQPIYQQLQGRGNFTQLLALIEKSGYKETLSSAGYWTLFAPTDSAFRIYYTENNLSGAQAVDEKRAREIVAFCLVYNAYKQERIADFQSNTGWVENNAFRRRTAFYTGVYDAVNNQGDRIKAIASNRNNNGQLFYVDADNNNKHLPIFETGFMTAKGLTAADYAYFYPGSTFSGFNVAQANVTEKDIVAENGVIHVVNRVIPALPSIDQYIGADPRYSEFKKLLDRFMVQYVLNQPVTQRYRIVNNTADDVFTKIYASSLAYSLNNENFLKLMDNDAQSDAYSIFVPENTALLTYINEVLLQHYPSVEALPSSVLFDFVNAHLWRTAVWPSKFSSTFNSVGEEARFQATTDVTDKRILSNGIFYGTNKVQQANVFSSVYGKAYLNPNYSIMTSLLNLDLKFQISNIRQRYTLFLPTNAAFNAAGFFVDPTVSNNINEQWRFIPPGGGAQLTGSSALVRLQRILNMHVIPNNDITSATAPNVGQSNSGDFVTVNNGRVNGSGNLETNTAAIINRSELAANGTVHYIDRLLTFTERTIGRHIESFAAPATSPYNSFWQYLRNSSIYNTSTGEIVQVASGTFYTFFIPDNAAIQAAVNAGLLPFTIVSGQRRPNFTPTLLAEREMVSSFIYYHILNKKNIASDGLESGTFETMYRFPNGDPSTLFVNNSSPNSITVNDMMNRTAAVRLTESNVLSNRCTIHLVNNYLSFK